MLRFTAFLNEAVKGEQWHKEHPVNHMNIVDHFKQATTTELHQGLTWYKRAHRAAEEIAKDTGHSITTTAGLIANYSPQTEWNTNLHISARVAKSRVGIGGKTQEPYEGKKIMAPDVRRKAADAILSGKHYKDVLKGNKVQHFAHLIEYGGDAPGSKYAHVAIDRHAWSVAAGARMPDSAFKVPGNKLYNHVAGAYIHAARHINKEARERGDSFRIEPHQLQAVTWLVRQRKNNEEDRASAVRTMAKGNSWLPGFKPTAKDLPKSFAADKTRVGASQRWVGYAKQHHPKIAGLFEEKEKMMSHKEAVVFMRGLKDSISICKKETLGDPLNYGRSREIAMALSLGHRVGRGWEGGADGIDKQGREVEYKSVATASGSLSATYNGISVKDSLAEEIKYIKKDKIGKYHKHYVARFDGIDIVEMWEMDGKDVEKALLPKIIEIYKRGGKTKKGKTRADQRIGVSLSKNEIASIGRNITNKLVKFEMTPQQEIEYYKERIKELEKTGEEKPKSSSKDTVKKAVQTKTVSLEPKPETTAKNGHPAGIPSSLIGKKVHLQTGAISEPKSPGVIRGMVSALKNAVVGKRKEQQPTQIGADHTQKGDIDLDKLDNIQLGQIAGERGGQHKEKAIKILQQRKKEGKYHGKVAA